MPTAFTHDAHGLYAWRHLRMMGAVFTNDAYSVSPCCSFWRNRGWDCCQHAAATLEPSRIDRSNERFDRSNESIDRAIRTIELNRSNERFDRSIDSIDRAIRTNEPNRSIERFDRSNRFEPIERTNRSIERIDRSNDSMDRPASFDWPRMPRCKVSRAPPDPVGRSRCPHMTVFMHDAHGVYT